MKKEITLFSVVLLCMCSNAQIGVNTPDPKVSFQVAKSPDSKVFDGILPPKTTGEFLRSKNYSIEHNGAIVYITLADPSPQGQTIDVQSVGLYYFKYDAAVGGKWVKFLLEKPKRAWEYKDYTSPNGHVSNGLHHSGNVAVGIDSKYPIEQLKPSLNKFFVNGGVELYDSVHFKFNNSGVAYSNFFRPYSINFVDSQLNANHKIIKSYIDDINNRKIVKYESFLVDSDTKFGRSLYMLTDPLRKNRGLGLFNISVYNKMLSPFTNNSYLGIDDVGIKIGYKIPIDGGFSSQDNNGLFDSDNVKIKGYYLPNTNPISNGQALSYVSSNGDTTNTGWSSVLIIDKDPIPSSQVPWMIGTDGNLNLIPAFNKSSRLILYNNASDKYFTIRITDDGVLQTNPNN